VELVSGTASPKHVSLVISDVDGTLQDEKKQLSRGAPAAVQRLYSAGVRFTLASARPPRMVRDLLDALKVREPFACFNGAVIVGTDEKILREYPMQAADAQLVADWIRDRGFELWVWTNNDWLATSAAGPHVAHHIEGMGRRPTMLTTGDISHLDVLKLVGVSDNYDALAAAEKELAAKGMSSISATRSSPYYLDVTASGANKGAVVVAMSELLGIPRDQIATIGDMITDTLMFRKSGISIAMGNAPDDVKALATYTTRSNDEDGFAYAMDTFVLGANQHRQAAD
jgi:Cof subfamily protein (haloacid dehalogenase superfamily)